MTKDFLIDINPDIELPKYELVLTKLTEEPITSLKNITDLEHNAFYVGIDELNFNIPFYRTEDNGDKVENEIYSLVEGDHLILVNDMKYFIINNVVEKADESGKVWKEVHCYSREYELSKKKLIDYKADSRLLYDDTNSMLDGLEKGILNYIFNHIVKSWTIGYVDPDIILREGKGIYRSLNFSNSNLTQVFNDLQRTYGCVFKFDTIKQEMNIYSIDKMMGQHRGLYISDGNFIKNISKDINTDEIITRLYIYGKDNISIQSISPTGQPYIDNFNYYKNTLNKNGQPKYMTQGLIDALDNYYTKVENYNPDFEPLLIRLQEANAVMEDLINADHIDDLNQKGLVALERYLSNLQTLIDVKTEEIAIIKNQITKATGENLIGLYDDLRATESALDSYNTDKDNVNNLIVAKKTEINNQQQIIDGIESELKALQDELNMSNSTNFTAEQLKELDKFIKVDIYNNSDYTENNIQELYDEGKKILNKASQPKIQFEVDVVDFLSLVECQHIWDKFTLGDIVTLEHKAIGFNYDVRLVGYEYNIDDNNLTLKFSNTDSFDDASLYLENLLDDFNTTGAVVDFNKDKWNNVGNVESRIAKMVDAKLEEARQNILNAVGQRYLFDDSGLWLYKENPDGTLNPEQIRAINNTIALTDDNWATPPKTAITPQGVVAENVYGKLGAFAQVRANQIIVGDDGETIPQDLIDGLPYINQQVGELDSSVNSLSTTINKSFSDNYITNIEANNLDLARKNVVKEAEDVKNIATSLSVSTTSITTAINNLNTEVNKYVGKTSYPISITSTNRTNMINAFTALESAIAQLYKAIDEKRDSNTRDYVDQQVGELDSSITGLQDNINNFGKDLILTATEAQTIKIDLERVTYESTDIIDIATALGITTEKNNYIAALSTLTNYLNMNWLNATYPLTITQTQISNVTTHFKYLDDRKMKLINKINEIRDSQTRDYVGQQVSELDGSIDELQNNINEFSDNSKLTLAESNAIEISLDNVNAESIDLINIASSLNITTEKDNYNSALTTLTNYLNTHWLGKLSYPIEITSEQRTNVSDYFKDVENKKSILINKITEVRAIKEINDKAIVKGMLYNGVKIDAESGFVATRTDGKARTIVNATDGIKIQKNRGTTQSPNWVSNFYTDINGNVILGEGSQISWGSVADKPTIPSQYTDALALKAWTDSGYATNINASGIYTGTLTADKIQTGTMTSTDQTSWLNMDNGTFNFRNQLKWSSTGLIIRGAGLKIQNTSNQNVLSGDSAGNLSLQGHFITYSGARKALELKNNSMLIYDWQNTTSDVNIGGLISVRKHNNNAPALALFNRNVSGTEISYTVGSTYYPYMAFDYDKVFSDTESYAPITVWESMRVNDGAYFGNSRWNRIVANDDILILKGNYGWEVSSNGYVNIECDSNRTDPMTTIWDYTVCKDDFDVKGDFWVRGRKDGLQQTRNYGGRLISAYETAEYYYGDIGSGIINEDGECLIHIDEIFQECVNTNINYHVFTQKYNGDIDTIRKEKSYFIVYGEPDTEFSWELKAKRIGYENERLEIPNKDSKFRPSILGGNSTETDIDSNKDTKRILEGKLEFDLSNILLTGDN